jgi:hypothetical protein
MWPEGLLPCSEQLATETYNKFNTAQSYILLF